MFKHSSPAPLFRLRKLIVHISQEKQRIKRQQQNKKIELSDLKSGEILILT